MSLQHDSRQQLWSGKHDQALSETFITDVMSLKTEM
jgi:hypothetical protein